MVFLFTMSTWYRILRLQLAWTFKYVEYTLASLLSFNWQQWKYSFSYWISNVLSFVWLAYSEINTSMVNHMTSINPLCSQLQYFSTFSFFACLSWWWVHYKQKYVCDSKLAFQYIKKYNCMPIARAYENQWYLIQNRFLFLILFQLWLA